MRIRPGIIGAVVLLGWTAVGAAAPLTCTVFKDRLNGAILATGAKDLQAAAFTLAFDSPGRGKRYAWTSDGIDTTLTCGTADQFEEIYLALAFEKKDTFAATLSRFVGITGSAACALATDGPGACDAFARNLLQTGLEQMGRAYKSGASSPSALIDRDVVPGVKAEFTAAPTLLTVLLGPGRGSSLDEARQTLATTGAPAPKP